MSVYYQDPLSWSLELEKHFRGEFSSASVQSHMKIEDKLEINCCSKAMFLGLYDGFKGDDASTFLMQSFFPSLLKNFEDYTKKSKTTNIPRTEVSKIIRRCYSQIEKKFTKVAESAYRENNPSMSVTSSGCLMSLVWGDNIFSANVGGSRAVLCYDNPAGRGLCGKLIINDDKMLHSKRHQVSHPTSKCIGNAYLKMANFTKMESFVIPSEERVESILTKPLLSAKPNVYHRVIKDRDRFIIFGSSGFWKLLTDYQAAKIVNSHPREGIARKLATHAVELAAQRGGLTYSQMMLVPEGIDTSGKPIVSAEPIRPQYHDDITVTVMFLDINNNVENKPFYSYHSHLYNVLPSAFKDADLDKLSKKDDPDEEVNIWDD